jgi:hypothetical protein
MTDDSTIRIESLPEFWKVGGGVSQEDTEEVRYRSHSETLWRGLYLVGRPITYVFGSDASSCYIGLSGHSSSDTRDIERLLTGLFPGISYRVTDAVQRPISWPYSAVLQGVPCANIQGLNRSADRVLRSLRGGAFLTVCDLAPIPRPEIEVALRHIQIERSEAEYERVRRPADAAVQVTVAQMEHHLQRLRTARTAGAWRVCLTVLTERPSDLATLCNALQASWTVEDESACTPTWNIPATNKIWNAALPSEVVALIPLPLESHAGFIVSPAGRLRTDPPGTREDERSILLGEILNGEAPTGVPLTYPVERLFEHFGIFGRTGTGKSTALRQILAQT